MSPDRTPLTGLPEGARIEALHAQGKDADMLPLTLTPEESAAAQSPGLPPEAPMPDRIVPVSPSTGFKSSEGKLAILAFVLGAVLEGVAIPLLERLAEKAPQLAWVPIVLVVLGVLLQVAVFLGYQRGRTALKLGSPQP